MLRRHCHRQAGRVTATSLQHQGQDTPIKSTIEPDAATLHKLHSEHVDSVPCVCGIAECTPGHQESRQRILSTSPQTCSSSRHRRRSNSSESACTSGAGKRGLAGRAVHCGGERCCIQCLGDRRQLGCGCAAVVACQARCARSQLQQRPASGVETCAADLA